jgi:hypothetical protein|tara:strand:+ start:335 stop:505 length:171 start_codon:yes stop_codon:yes gene_type:complete
VRKVGKVQECIVVQVQQLHVALGHSMDYIVRTQMTIVDYIVTVVGISGVVQTLLDQ